MKRDKWDKTDSKAKNRVMCPDCGKPKLLFETERKAGNFLRWNGDEIDSHGGELRAYYCPSCCGWHITHKKPNRRYGKSTERLIDAYRKTSKGTKRLDLLIRSQEYTDQARRVFSAFPDSVRKAADKGVLRKSISKYYSKNGIEDRKGYLRTAIYEVWENFNKR